jgi:hypothetical protein
MADWCATDLNLMYLERVIDFLKFFERIGAIWVVAEGFH